MQRTALSPLVATVTSLAIDAVAGEVVGALRRQGVRPVLLKGASIARWLYDDGHVRPYCDIDLLVAPDQRGTAETVLTELGYTPLCPGGAHSEVALHAVEWDRKGSPWVDLHYLLYGVEASPERCWEVLSAHTRELAVGGVEVDALAPPALAVQVVLHAVSSGNRNLKAVDDLARVIQRLALPEWRVAFEIARELDALAAFGVGLRLLPAGEELATALGVPKQLSVELVLRASSNRFSSLPFEQVANARGLRAKVAIVARELVPTPSFVRMWFPQVSRGRGGLVAGYGYRLVWITRHAPGGLRSWRRARRAAAAGTDVRADQS